MNKTPLHMHQATLHCNYNSEYQSIYEPSYTFGFLYIDDEEFDDLETVTWDDYGPFTDADIGQS